MRINTGRPTNTPVYLLRAEHKHLAFEGINRIRDKDCRKTLGYDTKQLIEELKEYAEPMSAGVLEDGKSYAYIDVSPFATAYRNGIMLRNHGEVYIYLAQFSKRGGCCGLHCANAWGTDAYVPIKSGMLLIESGPTLF